MTTTQTGAEALPPAPTGPLPPVLASNLEAIRALCREYGVVRLEVFGSALTSEFNPGTSDIDLLVEYPPDHNLGPWAEKHTGLAEQLSALLGRPVDLVMITAIRKPRFIEAVRDSRRLIYRAPQQRWSSQLTAHESHGSQGAQEAGISSARTSFPPDVLGMLEALQEAASYIDAETAGITYERFAVDRTIHAVVEYNVIKMGAVVSRLRRHAPEITGRLSGPDWVALREDLIVRYDAIDYPALWRTVTISLPVLRGEVEALLREQGDYSAGYNAGS